jgi:hypothetical protein
LLLLIWVCCYCCTFVFVFFFLRQNLVVQHKLASNLWSYFLSVLSAEITSK